MGNIKWYKRDPDAAIAGMIGLTLEQRGVYGTIIDLLYARDGDLPDDERFICKHLGCRPQTWRRIKRELMVIGKIRETGGGKLTANRVETELKLTRNRILKAQFAAQKRWENNDQVDALLHMTPTPTPIKKESKKEATNGNGKGRGKPRHGQETKDHLRVWLDAGTDEFVSYSDDYFARHHAAVVMCWGKSGAWFNRNGEVTDADT